MPSDRPRRSLADDFFARAATQPDHPLILGPGPDQAVTYGAFAAEVRARAAMLAGLGVVPGGNIGLHYPSGRDYIAYTYAIWACGACVTPIPTELAEAEKRLIAEHIAIDGIVTSRRGQQALAAGRDATAPPPAELPGQAVYLAGTRRRPPPPELAALHPAFIRFTSGTTGSAKGVVLSHQTIRERIAAANQVLAIGPGDRVVWMLSMAYHFAVTIVAYLSFGATIVLPANAFGDAVIKAANAFDATVIYGSPTHFELLAQDDGGQSLPPLRLAIVTTARLRPELAERFRTRFGRALNETFGIIEIGLPAINHDRPAERQGSVGRVLPAYELRLEQEDGAPAVPDADGVTTGEVLLRGPGLLDAYYDPWRGRADILAERAGWLATGDLGRLDADGYLTLVGRSKDLISVSGMKFFPQEVEAVLERWPGVAEACVYAVPDRHQGEVAQADLVLATGASRPAEADLLAHCRAALAGYKVPRGFRIVGALPRTATGKLLRRGPRPAAVP